MLKKTVTYEDFDGQKRTEDFYFNLTEAELTEMETSMNGGFSQLLQKIIQENDMRRIIEYTKAIVLKAYGEKSLDGRTFKKNATIREEFESSAAYSVIFMELAQDADKAADFIKGILPKSLSAEIDKVDANALPGQAPIDFKPQV